MRKLGFFQRILRGLVFKKPTIRGQIFALLFSGAFLAGGLLMGPAWVVPIFNFIEAQQWVAAQATVTSSEVERDGDSGKIAITYQYRYAGREFSGDRYDLGSTFTNVGISRMRTIVERHPVGKRVEVFVNPDEPEEALMIRALSMQVWIMVPFSMPFLLVGIVGVSYALFGGVVWRGSQKLKVEMTSKAPVGIAEALKGQHDSEDDKLTFTGIESIYEGVILLLVSIFWNGIVSVFLIVLVQMWMTGDSMALMISLFLIPFVLVGLFLLRTTFRSLFGSRSPAWVMLCESMMDLGKYGSASGTLNLMWMPEPGERPDFRKCGVCLVRMKSQQFFKKWKKMNPDWKSNLVPMKKGEIGEGAFEFEKLDSNEKSWSKRTYDLHLVLCWERPDGTEKEKTWQVSPIRNEGA
jgi:hypothetical protein